MTDISYLENLVERFLRNADEPGARQSNNRGVNLSGQLTSALETARQVHGCLTDRSRVLAWRVIHGLEATFDFPPLPKLPERASARRPAGPPRMVVCDPVKVRDPKHDVVGFICDMKPAQSVARLSPPGTDAFAELSADLRGGPFTELAVVDGDLIRYAFRVPLREVPIPRGALVRARILRKTSGAAPWFFCTRLWQLEIHALESPRLPVPQSLTESARRYA